jgi:hypothetical protein
MAPKDAAETEVDANAETGSQVEAGTNTEQVEIGWAEDLIKDFRPIPIGETDNGEAEDEPEPDIDEPVDEPEEKPAESGLIGEADYARNVAIANKDGSVTHKTIQQLIDGGMLKEDHTRKTQELARQREHLSADQDILNLLDSDKHARDYLTKRIEDIKSGKATDDLDDIELPPELLEQVPGLKKIITKLREHDIEISKSRSNTERTQADRTVGKISSVMEAARAAVEKDTGLKLEPDVFRARVGKNILGSLDDSVPEDRKIPIVGQMILTDKNYFMSKARESYQQEIELAKEKAIDAAKQERTEKANKTKPLKGGGTKAPSGDSGEFKMVKDKNGRPDMDAFLESAFVKKR